MKVCGNDLDSLHLGSFSGILVKVQWFVRCGKEGTKVPGLLI